MAEAAVAAVVDVVVLVAVEEVTVLDCVVGANVDDAVVSEMGVNVVFCVDFSVVVDVVAEVLEVGARTVVVVVFNSSGVYGS